MPPHLILVLQFGASAFMAGVIWLVQLAHYPLFAVVAGGRSQERFLANQWRTAAVVLPPMLLEGVSATVLVFAPPPRIGWLAAIVGLGLVAILWLSTALVQMPLHARLRADGNDPVTIARLVSTNWLRTAGWTARAVLAGWMLLATM
jgi:hypothetical protein